MIGIKRQYKDHHIKMLERGDLDYLIKLGQNGGLAISFYLGITPSINFKTEANSILAEKKERIKNDKTYSGLLQKKIAMMLNSVKRKIDLTRSVKNARSLAFFLKENGEVMAYRLPVYINSKLVIKSDFYIYPLANAIEEFSRYLVVAVDRDKAKFFSIFLGSIEEEPEIISSYVPKKINVSASDDWQGWRQKRIERHIDGHLKFHLKEVSGKIGKYLQSGRFEYLIVGIHREIKSKFLDILDKASLEKLIGFFNIPHPSRNLIAGESAAIVKKHKKDFEEKLVREIINSLGGKKWKAVAGIGAVLDNFYLNKIRMIVVGKNYNKSGFVCGRCHRIFLFAGRCISCGTKVFEVSDLVDEIAEEAIKNKIKMKQFSYNHEVFDRFGIGAFLNAY